MHNLRRSGWHFLSPVVMLLFVLQPTTRAKGGQAVGTTPLNNDDVTW